MGHIPQSLSEVELLVKNQQPESIHLDYKASPALAPEKRAEISKDVSAFANSDGGVLIYGVEEDGQTHLPVRVDAGVDPKRDREWLERIITSHINPRIDGIEIRQFELSTRNLVLCIQIPKSFRGPHQAEDKRYYKRFNFSSCPMEHYEIEDVRFRRQVSPPLVTLDLDAPHGAFFEFLVRNIGDIPAKDLTFKAPADMKWPDGAPPAHFRRGITVLPPGRTIHIFYYAVFEILEETDSGKDPKFDIEVSYTNAHSGQKVTETFQFDLGDYRGTRIVPSEIEQHAEKMSKLGQELTRAVQNLTMQLEHLTPLAGPTGLQLSFTSLKNLKHLLRGKDEVEKIPPEFCTYRAFQEVLGVDVNLAIRLEQNFRHSRTAKIDDIKGMTPELIKEFGKIFRVPRQNGHF